MIQVIGFLIVVTFLVQGCWSDTPASNSGDAFSSESESESEVNSEDGESSSEGRVDDSSGDSSDNRDERDDESSQGTIESSGFATSSDEESDELVIEGGDLSYYKTIEGVGRKEQTEYVFDDDTVRTYELVIPSKNLAYLDDAPMREEYVAGALIVDGDTISPVGIRYKGNEGAWYGCVVGGPWGGGMGDKQCPLNMKVKINWEGRDTTFFGLKKYQLHAMNAYESELRERIGYWFYRQMGIPAPRVVHVKLKINGEYEGLYAHVEQIDGRFTRYNFEDGTGNLYKEVWPLTYDSTATTGRDYERALKTNEDEEPSVALIQGFGELLEDAEDVDVVRETIETYMDVEELNTIAALSYILDDDDGLFHWYAHSATTKTAAGPHNFFIYEEPTTQKIHLIPWDNDLILDKVALKDTMNAVEIWDDFGKTSHDCETFGHGWNQKSAACDKLIAGWASYTEQYKEALQSLYDGPFQQYESVLDQWVEQLAPVVAEMAEEGVKSISISEWERGVEKLRSELKDSEQLLLDKLSSTDH
ncbi:MAG: CotH kinase family protein [Fibrobacterales bacterium]